MSIEVKNIVKRFGAFTALNDINLSVSTGELMALLGPSGSGKTTLLRIIAGLEFPDRGSVLFNDEETTGRSARERRVGFVFQHYALFRHMTVLDNVAFGLKVKPRGVRPSKTEIREKARALLHLVQLDWLANHYPYQLSGGQRQRIALARALAVEPQVLLLDEPFGALDAKVRQELRRWLRELHQEMRITSVFVTHDQEEALEIADRVVVMNEGRIEQVGPPEEIYHHPASPFVHRFLGAMNIFEGRVENDKVTLGGLAIDLPEPHPEAKTARVYIRPHQLEIHTQRPISDHGFPARISHINSIGPLVKLELNTEWGGPFHVELSHERSRSLQLKKGATVYVTPKEKKIFVEFT